MSNKRAGDVLIAQAVFDEAGDTGQQKHSSRYLIVAGVVCSDVTALRRVVAQTRKRLNKKRRDLPEVKAARLAPRSSSIVTQVLTSLAALDVEVYAAILDKWTSKPPVSGEDWYRHLYTECIKLALAHHAGLWVLMDRRYTKIAMQEELVTSIQSAQRPNTILTLEPRDSQTEPALQVADVVAWSIFHKYERGADDFYQIIQPRIIREILC
jgi:hypothetical protein